MRASTFVLLVLSGLVLAPSIDAATPSPAPKITVLYDAFGDPGPLRKDWGFAALIEVNGKRILFDTGNDAEVFAHNLKTQGVDLAQVDTVVLSHRHSDHTAGLAVVLAANPDVEIHAPQEGFGLFGSSLPSSFYRKDNALPARQRYFDGAPPQTLKFGSAWPNAHFNSLAKTTEIAPGVWAIITTSEVAGTRELRELSLALHTPEGLLLVVGCSHPGLPVIVAEAAKLDPQIHLVVGGFHYVNADDRAIAGLIEALRPYAIDFIAPGHCTGEATFAALQAAYGKRYLYAGLGTTLSLGKASRPDRSRGQAAALSAADHDAYSALAQKGTHAHDKPFSPH